jgi:hypothetical protein
MRRHCERRRRAAIQEHALDCFATFAMTNRLAAAALLLLASACREDRPPAPTEQESAQLNEMESALNDMSQNEEGPEANAPGPSNQTN